MGRKIVFTESQLIELKSLINSGMRQTDIAKHFSVTDDTIRRICRENEIVVKMPHKCICSICGDVFYSNVKDAKTCSKEHHRNCVVCGKDFIVDRYNVRNTCSAKCSSVKKYGVEFYLQSREAKEKTKQTLKEKYGVENISQVKEVKDKVKQTCLEKYGAENYMQTEEGQAKRKATNLEKYGVEEILADKKFREQIAKINVEKYGVEHPMQTKEIRAKHVAKMNKLYNVDNPMQVEEFRSKLLRIWKEEHFDTSNLVVKFRQLLSENNIEFESEFALGQYLYDIKVNNYLIEINPTITHNSALSIFPNTLPTDPKYHLNKSQIASENGYQCIHVFDWDDWNRILLLIQPKEHIYARKCKVVEVDRKTAEEFTSKYHIQGACIGQNLNLGLEYNGQLIQVMTFGKPRYTRKYDLELLRLCSISNIRVIGGASKLFKHFTNLYPDKSILSYCNLSKFNGKVYEEIGMTLHHISEPAKVWSKNNEYITDNYLRQRGFDQIFHTNFGKGSSNEELMLKHKWLPVYDCGQKVFVWSAN